MEDDNLMNAVAQKIEEIKLRKRVKKLLEEEEQSEDPLENILEELGVESLDDQDFRIVSEIFELLKHDPDDIGRFKKLLQRFFIDAKHKSMVSQFLEKSLREIRKEREQLNDQG